MGNSNKNFMGAAFIALGLFILAGFAWGGYEQMSALRAAITEREQIITERKDLIAKITKLQEDAQSKIGDAQKFSAVVPTRKDLEEVISALDRLAQRSGVSLGELTIGENKTASGDDSTFKLISINIKGVGSYGGIRAFMGDLEKNIRLIDMGSIDVAPQEGTGRVTFDIKAQAYFLP